MMNRYIHALMTNYRFDCEITFVSYKHGCDLDYSLLFGGIYPLKISTNQNVIYKCNIKCQIMKSHPCISSQMTLLHIF